MIGYFGSITKKTFSPPPAENDRERWAWETSGYIFRVEGANSCTATLERNGKKLVLQGIAHRNGQPFHRDQAVILEEILADYETSGVLKIDGLEGSFTVFLIDTATEKLLLYRNFVGSTFTYYTATPEGFFWGDSFAEVAKGSGQSRVLNEEMLPVLFIGRYPTGQKTLLKNIFRLYPGELLEWSGIEYRVKQVTTLADFEEPRKTSFAESVERVESTTREIIDDWFQLYPHSANLLSGGVDSTYLQIHWNNRWKQSDLCDGKQKPKCAFVWLDHPRMKPDYDYTMTAVEQTDSDVLAIKQPSLTAARMREIIRRNGDFPNHVQSFYFATLAERMREHGFDGAVSGIGADVLFGTEIQDAILDALWWRRRFSFPGLRTVLKYAATLVGKKGLCHRLRTSEILDDVSDFQHPVNRVLAFTDIPTLLRCFSEAEIGAAMKYRREVPDVLQMPKDPDHLFRSLAVGYYCVGTITSACWTKYSMEAGLRMCSPFLDSRMIRVANNIALDAHFVPRKPKAVLKKALLKHVPETFVNRPKRGFGQPIFEWLSPGGCLREAAENIADYPFMPKQVKQDILDKPNWILWTLLCFDLWHKELIG